MSEAVSSVSLEYVWDKDVLVGVIAWGPLNRTKRCGSLDEALLFLSGEFKQLADEKLALEIYKESKLVHLKGRELDYGLDVGVSLIVTVTAGENEFLGFGADNELVVIGKEAAVLKGLQEEARKMSVITPGP